MSSYISHNAWVCGAGKWTCYGYFFYFFCLGGRPLKLFWLPLEIPCAVSNDKKNKNQRIISV
jgi:hypothetical protein